MRLACDRSPGPLLLDWSPPDRLHRVGFCVVFVFLDDLCGIGVSDGGRANVGGVACGAPCQFVARACCEADVVRLSSAENMLSFITGVVRKCRATCSVPLFIEQREAVGGDM